MTACILMRALPRLTDKQLAPAAAPANATSAPAAIAVAAAAITAVRAMTFAVAASPTLITTAAGAAVSGARRAHRFVLTLQLVERLGAVRVSVGDAELLIE